MLSGQKGISESASGQIPSKRVSGLVLTRCLNKAGRGRVYRKYRIDDISVRLITITLLRRSSMATFIVGIFIVIIVGAAGTFAYVVFFSDDRGTRPTRERSIEESTSGIGKTWLEN